MRAGVGGGGFSGRRNGLVPTAPPVVNAIPPAVKQEKAVNAIKGELGDLIRI